MECHLILSIDCRNAQCVVDSVLSPVGIKCIKTRCFVKILQRTNLNKYRG